MRSLPTLIDTDSDASRLVNQVSLSLSPFSLSLSRLQITPYMREIYIIQLIKTKIIDHCNQVAAASG